MCRHCCRNSARQSENAKPQVQSYCLSPRYSYTNNSFIGTVYTIYMDIKVIVYDISAGSNKHCCKHQHVESPVGKHHINAVNLEYRKNYQHPHCHHCQCDYQNVFPANKLQEVFHIAKIQFIYDLRSTILDLIDNGG